MTTTQSSNVNQTTDYEMFSLIEENRAVDLNTPKRKQLMDSIKENGLLNPIVIDKNNGVVDGQHRLEICKKLRIPVIYTRVDRVYSLSEIQELNNRKDDWKIEDYVVSEIKKGNKHYRLLKEYSEKYGVNVSIVASALSGVAFFSREDLQSGKFIVTHKEEGTELLSRLLDTKNKTGNMNVKLYRAMRTVFESDNYNHDRMMKQLEKYYKELFNKENCRWNMSSKEHAMFIEKVYNWYRSDKYDLVSRYSKY